MLGYGVLIAKSPEGMVLGSSPFFDTSTTDTDTVYLLPCRVLGLDIVFGIPIQKWFSGSEGFR